MAQYKYKGINLNNKSVKSTITARTIDGAYLQLKELDIFAHSIELVPEKKLKTHKFKSNELAEFSRQIGTMQEAGISIIKAIDILRNREPKPQVKAIYDNLYEVINEGNSLAQAMNTCEGSFKNIMINVYKSGEATGKLDESALSMAVYYEKEHKMNAKIKSALAYPSILAIITVIVVLGMFTFILPIFFEFFEGTQLPLITQIMLNISNFITNQWYYLILMVVAIVSGIGFLQRIDSVVTFVDKIKISLKTVGKLCSIIYTARFARTLSSLYSSGVSMIEAVEISVTTIGNRYIEKQFDEILQQIQNGNSLSDSMNHIDGFDQKLISAIYIGEESGKLENMLNSMADNFEHDSEIAIDKLITYIEPIMIVIMAIIIGVVLISVMMPLMSIYTTLG